jgi:hypothetical protein
VTLQELSINTEDLRSEATSAEHHLQLRLMGTAEYAARPALIELLKRVHAHAVSQGIREVAIDLRELEFMNSSCFTTFVGWVGQVEALEPARQYHIVFRSDDSKHWQARSLGALACFSTQLIRIEA